MTFGRMENTRLPQYCKLFLRRLPVKSVPLNVPSCFQERDAVVHQKLLVMIAYRRCDNHPLVVVQFRRIAEVRLESKIDRSIEKERVVALSKIDSDVCPFFIKTPLFDQLRKAAPHLRPFPHNVYVGSGHGKMKRKIGPAAVFLRQPLCRVFILSMLPHIFQHSLPTFRVTVPLKKRIVNLVLRHDLFRCVSGKGSPSIRAVLCLMIVQVPLCFMIDGQHSSYFMLPVLRCGGNNKVIADAEIFQAAWQFKDRERTDFNLPHSWQIPLA